MNDKLSGPDLTEGIAVSALAAGSMLPGHARGEPVLLARRGDEFFAIGGACTHYGARPCFALAGRAARRQGLCGSEARWR